MFRVLVSPTIRSSCKTRSSNFVACTPTGKLAARQNVIVPRNGQRCSLSSSSSSNKHPTNLPPPLPPSPSKAKKEYLKSKEVTLDPIAKMAELQKELDVVRERAVEKLEQRLTQRTVWQRLTDPLRRHQHSLINVGAVLLAYILAHNLYQSSKRNQKTLEELQLVKEKMEEYQATLRTLVSEQTLQELANSCVKGMNEDHEMTDDTTTTSSRQKRSSWFRVSSNNVPSSTEFSKKYNDQEELYQTLKRELQARVGDSILSEEEIRIRDMQRAWQESQEQLLLTKRQATTTTKSPEQALVEAVLADGAEDVTNTSTSTNTSTKKPKQVFSM